MNKQKELLSLTNFFKNALVNEEVSRTEVENFLRTYLEYIFKLNNVDISKYDIRISKHQIDEYHPKREKQFKNQPNQEKRLLEKRKTLTKPAFKSNCGNHYFEAIMYPHPTIDTQFTIAINQNLCHAKNFGEIERLIYLFHVFGHEVHHIIQYIRYNDDMFAYDASHSIHDNYLKAADDFNLPPREIKKLKRAINQHLDLIFSCCSCEKFADKKGYDYLDILFNDILKLNANIDLKLTNFIETLQEYNECIYLDRLDFTKRDEYKIEEITERLSQLVDDQFLLEIT